MLTISDWLATNIGLEWGRNMGAGKFRWPMCSLGEGGEPNAGEPYYSKPGPYPYYYKGKGHGQLRSA